MRAIIGLGNPGSEYDDTRHNTGFAVVDAICERFSVRLSRRYEPWLAGSIGDVLLVKPLTYMNNSGAAVHALLTAVPVAPSDLVVIVDDFHLPLGTLRLRRTGSSGGHNGLASIISALESEAFPRLRCGIGSGDQPGPRMPMAEFVLSTFTRNERDAARSMVGQAAEIAVTVAREGYQAGLAALSRRTV